MKIGQVVEEQREFFRTGKTLSYTFRDEQLQRLYASVSTRQKKILAALQKDLHKSDQEAYLSDIGLVLA